jgi:D-amino-acid dehydrogenase
VVVVGAGIVGLSTAWFLQDHDIEVLVLDQRGVAAGASWGNAGWIAPTRAVPLTEPSAVREGLLAMVNPRAQFFAVSPGAGLHTWQFLARFALHCTPSRWARARLALAGLNRHAWGAYDRLCSEGLPGPVTQKPLIAAFTRPRHASHLYDDGDLEALPLAEGRRLVPQLSTKIRHVVQVNGVGYVQPARFLEALAISLAERGGIIQTPHVVRLDRAGRVLTDSGPIRADAVVVATGADIGRLAGPCGVRVPVCAGRGYSFTVSTESAHEYPLYFPHQRVTCTPDGERLRVTSTMEFARPNNARTTRRIDAIARRIEPLMEGAEWTGRKDEWCGARPVTVDGLPLIGATRLPHVFVAGGHGMWGMTQGPASGELLAHYIATGDRPTALVPFDPLR